ncbi:MAG: hypothetical protein SGPRY_009004, partial [Prymnesium sp.]
MKALHAGLQLPMLADPEAELKPTERKEAIAALPPKPRAALQACHSLPLLPSTSLQLSRLPDLAPPLRRPDLPSCRLTSISLEKALSGKSATSESFLEAVWEAETVLGEQCVRIDRKREKAALATTRASLRSQLESTGQVEIALHLSVLLLEIEMNGLFFQTRIVAQNTEVEFDIEVVRQIGLNKGV